MSSDLFEKVAVIGAGTMGNGIAQVFASCGSHVTLVDLNEDALKRGMEAIESSLARVVKKERMTQADADATMARLSKSTRLEDLTDQRLIVEAVSERADIKASVFKTLDAVAHPDAILGSNTSSISITEIAANTKRPDKVIGMHFMNPVPVMKLVEVIRGHQTSDATTDAVMAASRALGKEPVAANDYPGFVSNRVLMPMINEAVFCLMEGVATREGIDTVMKLGMAHPMGPLTLADLIGLDVCLDILEVLHRGLGDDKYRPCPLLRRMVAAGCLGRKSGRGFYDYQ
ncbi:putative 3-hydroxybutyryl-CoA dehydrogenase [Planctomycetes bacterium Poly30]|uniref:Putative 3-hydroxybutyryl-CoA dehydrogenase n=1 Tax=Saltatorellus ferox TaxID=2528018 RepID=A0A518EY55_9BACT|nr:putative 3-hydroxybutyryl-CoA dehydrogenase [Planctomycetes bacterium Poly30]